VFLRYKYCERTLNRAFVSSQHRGTDFSFLLVTMSVVVSETPPAVLVVVLDDSPGTALSDVDMMAVGVVAPAASTGVGGLAAASAVDGVAAVDDTAPAKLPKEVQDVLDEVAERAKCQICFDMCMPPFRGCTSGHNYCNTCLPKLKKCPLCKSKKLDCRQLGLENIASSMKWPCNLAEMGCTEILRLEDFNKHAAVCCFRADKYCPYANCEDHIMPQPEAFRKHMVEKHKNRDLCIESGAESTRILMKAVLTDYKGEKLGKNAVQESHSMFRIGGVVFTLSTIETFDSVSFKSSVVHDRATNKDRYICHRQFSDLVAPDSNFKYCFSVPVVSVTERASLKRKTDATDKGRSELFDFFSVKKSNLEPFAKRMKNKETDVEVNAVMYNVRIQKVKP